MMSKFNDACKQNQEYLLKYLEDRNLTGFTNLLEDKDENKIDPNHEYSDPYYKTCLAIASERGMVRFIQVLLAYGADPNLICASYGGNAPIHFAAENEQLGAIKCLAQHPATKVSIVNRKLETALHITARNLTTNDRAELCFSYLASLSGMDVRLRNVEGRTAISEAVGKCSRYTLQRVLQHHDFRREDRELILDNDLIREDRELILDNDLRREDRELFVDNDLIREDRELILDNDLRREDRELILNNHLELKYKAPENTKPAYTRDDAYMDLKNGNVDRFRHNFRRHFIRKTDLTEMTFLQLACKQGFLHIVKLLLNWVADVNETGTHESKPSVYLACYYGQYDVLVRLLNKRKKKVELIKGKTLLHTVLEGFSAYRHVRDRYHACFDYLLQEHERLSIPINHGDNYGHTALHYAVHEDNDHFPKALLAHRAYIGSLNKFGICPLNDIDPKTLQTALNGCVYCIREEKGNEYTLVAVSV
jgi:ankyrin repeat protein